MLVSVIFNITEAIDLKLSQQLYMGRFYTQNVFAVDSTIFSEYRVSFLDHVPIQEC